jgi:Flp pilus assembly protein TadD
MVTNQMLGNAYASARRYPEAIGQYRKGLELHPDDSSLQLLLGWAYVYNGAMDQGIAAIQSSLDVDGIDPRLSPDLAVIDAMRGETNEARQTLNRLLTLAESQPVSPGMIALVYIAVDDGAQGLNWLEKAYQRHSSIMTWLKTDPRFDKVRGEARFRDLMRRVGLI